MQCGLFCGVALCAPGCAGNVKNIEILLGFTVFSGSALFARCTRWTRFLEQTRRYNRLKNASETSPRGETNKTSKISDF